MRTWVHDVFHTAHNRNTYTLKTLREKEAMASLWHCVMPQTQSELAIAFTRSHLNLSRVQYILYSWVNVQGKENFLQEQREGVINKDFQCWNNATSCKVQFPRRVLHENKLTLHWTTPLTWKVTHLGSDKHKMINGWIESVSYTTSF